SGGLGSGKSSTSGRALALGMLRAGMGGLVLTVKSDETEHWREYAALTGRTDDLIIFNDRTGLAFDPLAYFWNMPGRGGGFLETIIELFTTLISIGKQDVGSNNERFFELAVEELIRAALVLLSAAGEAISIVSIHNLIVSLPVSPDQIENDQWQS